MDNEENYIDNTIMSYTETVFKQIVKRDDENTKQVIKDYVRQKYPNKNVRIDFLDEEVIDKIIDLGIREYLKEMRKYDFFSNNVIYDRTSIKYGNSILGSLGSMDIFRNN